MLRKALLASAFLCGGLATLLTIWIVVPAPSFLVFQVAVGASEWSLWFGALGLAGAGLSLLARAAGSVRAAWLALSLGVAAVGLSLIPPLESWRVARENRIELSAGQYLFGSQDDHNAGVERTTETFATVEGQTLKLDVYLAPVKEATLMRAAVVVVHGGSWSAGERSDYPLWNEWLARQGYAVFDVDYRLAPQPNWQTATGDVKCAVGWVRANAGRFAVDPARIALLGRSAGGHLALLAAYSTNESALPPSCAAPDASVRAVVSLYAPTDLKWGYEHPANRRVLDGPGKIRNFVGGTPASAPEAIRLASATTHVNSLSPPTLLFHGGRDQLVSDRHMTLLTERLSQQRVSHRALLIPYAQHAFDYNFDGWGSQLTRPLLLNFLREHLN
ncbi:MAG TPA: alpha/beta hydrolase [Pyrinomonadaceae bacterium]|jgi:acetyl esterase/lipase|nr:alpha/beta hydrolase [Pyrinomonadaceae bacterium]